MLAMGDMREPRRTHVRAVTALADPPFADRRIAAGVARHHAVAVRMGGDSQAARAFRAGRSDARGRGCALVGEPVVVARSRARRVRAGVVVVLAGPDAKPAMVATAERGSRYLTVKAVATVDVPPGRALELWMLPDGRAPVSIGLVPASGIDRLALRAPVGVALQDIPALAVSVEPPGGSPTGAPTGPVVYTGRVERIY